MKPNAASSNNMPVSPRVGMAATDGFGMGGTTVIVTVSAMEEAPRLSVTMSEKVSVWFAAPAASVGAVKVGLAAVAFESVMPAGAVQA